MKSKSVKQWLRDENKYINLVKKLVDLRLNEYINNDDIYINQSISKKSIIMERLETLEREENLKEKEESLRLHYNRQTLKSLNKEWLKYKSQERKKAKEIKNCQLKSNTSTTVLNKDTF